MKTLYIDMDNVLVDFQTGIDRITDADRLKYDGRLDEVPHMFAIMDPIPGAIDAFHQLSGVFDTYILSTAPWENRSAWSDKLDWVKKYIGAPGYKRLILSHHKNLNAGDFLIDDRTKNGVDKFRGEHIHFGTDQFPNWDAIIKYLIP